VRSSGGLVRALVACAALLMALAPQGRALQGGDLGALQSGLSDTDLLAELRRASFTQSSDERALARLEDLDAEGGSSESLALQRAAALFALGTGGSGAHQVRMEETARFGTTLDRFACLLGLAFLPDPPLDFLALQLGADPPVLRDAAALGLLLVDAAQANPVLVENGTPAELRRWKELGQFLERPDTVEMPGAGRAWAILQVEAARHLGHRGPAIVVHGGRGGVVQGGHAVKHAGAGLAGHALQVVGRQFAVALLHHGGEGGNDALLVHAAGPGGTEAVGRGKAAVVGHVSDHAVADLVEGAGEGGALGALEYAGEYAEGEARQDGDDGDDGEQFDERETARIAVAGRALGHKHTDTLPVSGPRTGSASKAPPRGANQLFYLGSIIPRAMGGVNKGGPARGAGPYNKRSHPGGQDGTAFTAETQIQQCLRRRML